MDEELDKVMDGLDETIMMISREPSRNKIENLRTLLGILQRKGYDVGWQIDLYNGLRDKYSHLFMDNETVH